MATLTRKTIFLLAGFGAVMAMCAVLFSSAVWPPRIIGIQGNLQTLDPICSGHEQEFGCYNQYYRRLVRERGIPAAFADLKARYPLNPYIRSQCHPLTHMIGQEAVKAFDQVSEAYQHGDSYCWSGYYHGVMEGIMLRMGREGTLKNLNTICSSIPGKSTYSFDYYNCVHGLGHGLMALSNDELFQSLDTCSTLVGSWEQMSCDSGVFMENIIANGEDHVTHYLKASEPLYPCTAVDTKHKLPCYLMQTSYMLKLMNWDFKKVFALCQQSDPGFINTCYQSLGRDASGSTVSDKERTKALCLLGKDFDQQSNCIIGAAKDFVSYFHSDVQAKQLCDSLATDLQRICYDTVNSYYQSFTSP